jgi:hypothetical protein
MIIHSRWIRFALLGGLVAAVAAEPPTEPDPLEQLPPREAAVERLLSERGEPAAFDKLIADARKLGVGDQAILEARFLYHVDRQDDDALAAMVPEFLAFREKFDAAKSEIFSLKDDWLAVVEYVQAIAALQNGERDRFKQHITEAFWLSPRQGAAFASHIERLRTAEAMSKLRIDFTTKLDKLQGGDQTELSALVHQHKALALHFWSPWSRECEAFADDFAATTRALEQCGIAVASILAENDPRVVDDARRFAADYEDIPCHWLRDRENAPMHVTLRVQSVPLLVLASPDGRILFNGHPADPDCWKALQQIAPDLERPALTDPPDNP